MIRWVETFPHAIPGHMKLLEPTKYRNLFFESAKKLIPLGDIKFSPRAPKGDILVLEDGTERKLSRAELASLLQMDMMKDEMCAMMRFKNQQGRITYGLPVALMKKMHDDRNYVAIMCCWWIDQLQQNDILGDEVGLNFDYFVKRENPKQQMFKEDQWNKLLSGRTQNSRHREQSPFSGENPFK